MSVSGIVTAPGSAAETVAVTVTLSPARTGLRGETDSSTVGVSSSSMVTATEAGVNPPPPWTAGSPHRAPP